MAEHSPEMLRGAEAFISMLSEIGALERVTIPNPDPDIEDDDCSRHDYAAADQIVLDRLREVLGFRDLTHAGRGFIQAMAVYLLTECDWCGKPLWWGNGEELLSDDGWRRDDINQQ